MKLALLAALALLGPAAFGQTTWFVDAGAAPGGNGSQANPFSSIQAAIDVAASNDEVQIAAGTYAPFRSTVAVDLIGPSAGTAVVARAAAGAGAPNWSSFGPGSSIRIERLVFDGSGGVVAGPALRVTRVGEVELVGCTFQDCTTTAETASLEILFATGQPDLLVQDCTFVRGQGAVFGAVRATLGGGNVIVRDCLFEDNVSTTGAAGFFAGTLYVYVLSGQGVLVEGCEFLRNSSPAVNTDSIPNALVHDCSFVDNGRGEHAALVGTPWSIYNPLFSDCTLVGPLDASALPESPVPILPLAAARLTIVGNPGGVRASLTQTGILEDSTVVGYDAGPFPLFDRTRVARCTLYKTASSVPALDTFSRATACIFADHSGPIGTVNEGVTFSNVPNGPAIDPTNIDAPPYFFAPLAGDFRLAVGSPCIGTGAANGALDMGAVPFDPAAVPEAASYCPGKVTSEGCVPELTASNVPRLGAGIGMTLDVTNLVAGQFGLFFLSPEGLPAAPAAAGQQICTGSPSLRSSVVPVTGSGPCGGVATLDLSATEIAMLGFLPSDTIRIQFIARDPANPDGSGITLSNAVEALFLD